MAVIRIKNLNTALHRRLRFIGANGSTIDIQEQDGAVVLFGTKDLRICLSPNTTDSPNSATIDTSVIEMLGKFNIDVDSELFENVTPEELFDIFNPDSIMEVIGDPTPYNIQAEYISNG